MIERKASSATCLDFKNSWPQFLADVAITVALDQSASVSWFFIRELLFLRCNIKVLALMLDGTLPTPRQIPPYQS